MRALVPALIACAAAAGDAPALLRAEPGFQPAVMAEKSIRYAVHIPAGYPAHAVASQQPAPAAAADGLALAEEAPARPRLWPVLFCQNPSGNPAKDVRTWGPWADRMGVVVVGIIGPANGMAQHEKPPIQDAVARSIERDLHVHPRLRFTWGVSGGSADGGRFVRRKPDGFAGACLVAAFSNLGQLPRQPWIAVGVVHGAKDEICGAKGVLSADIPGWTSAGHPARMNLHQMGAHSAGPPGAAEEQLTWMVWLGKLTAPFLAADEVELHRRECAAWADAIAAEPDPVRQRRAADLFLELPTAGIPGAEAVAAAWQRSVLAEIAAAPPADRPAIVHDALHAERWERTAVGKGDGVPCWIVTRNAAAARVLPEPVRAAIAAAAPADAGSQRDWELRQRLRAAVLAEIDAGLDFAANDPVAAAYEALAAAEPGNRWCQEAAAHAARIRSWIARKGPGSKPATAAAQPP